LFYPIILDINLSEEDNMFKKNIGKRGRILRFFIALLLLIFAFLEKSWITFFLSLFVFFEALFSWCVLYQLLGKNSCPLETKKDE
jgi:DUF2892 family protein